MADLPGSTADPPGFRGWGNFSGLRTFGYSGVGALFVEESCFLAGPGGYVEVGHGVDAPGDDFAGGAGHGVSRLPVVAPLLERAAGFAEEFVCGHLTFPLTACIVLCNSTYDQVLKEEHPGRGGANGRECLSP